MYDYEGDDKQPKDVMGNMIILLKALLEILDIITSSTNDPNKKK